MSKRGQVTIFIIIALLVVAGVALFFTLSPNINIGSQDSARNPQDFIDNCLRDSLEEKVELISLQGGSLEPESSYQYDNYNLEYLCYTNEYYKFCKVQRPFLRTHIEDEITSGISQESEQCFNSLKESYEDRGYEVDLQGSGIKSELLPERVIVNFNKTMYLEKGGDSEKYENFRIVLNNNLYDLVAVSESMVESESAVGTAEPSYYMNLYHDLLVHKKTQSDETTIYIVEDTKTGNKFQFASRSLPYPPGYGEI